MKFSQKNYKQIYEMHVWVKQICFLPGKLPNKNDREKYSKNLNAHIVMWKWAKKTRAWASSSWAIVVDNGGTTRSPLTLIKPQRTKKNTIQPFISNTRF